MDRERRYSDDPELSKMVHRAEEQYEDEQDDYEYDGDDYDTEVDDEDYDEYGPEQDEYADEYDDDADEDGYDDADEDSYDDADESPQPTAVKKPSSSPEDWRRFISSLSMDTICYSVFTLLCLAAAAYWHTYYNTQIRKVTGREEVLKDIRYRRLYMSAELVRLERISSIESRIESLQLGLQHPTQPPYEVIDTTNINKEDQ